MSSGTILNSRSADAVLIGSMTLYCESFSVSAARVLCETSTVGGEGTVTNTYSKNARITLKGRAFSEEAPMYHAIELDSLLREGSVFDTDYRGMTLKNCQVQSYTVSDTGRSELDVSVVLAAEYFEEEEEE